jgi:hypothetical protein
MAVQTRILELLGLPAHFSPRLAIIEKVKLISANEQIVRAS